MYKSKEGKVFATLTEVKNKTGDIFAIVDEFGEITLTSYGKSRYRIVKVALEEVMNINEDTSSPRKKNDVSTEIETKRVTKKEGVRNVSDKHSGAASTEEESLSEKDMALSENLATENPAPKVVESTEEQINIIPWNRNNADEKNFVIEIISPLITN